jgi:hypothetical protein
MKFFKDYVFQGIKDGNSISGDYTILDRSENGTFFAICDGIGSGIYANIAAITCAARLKELFASGMSVRTASEMVAASMHRARTEDIPFSAFLATAIFPDGRYQIYTYEAPNPILIEGNSSKVLSPHFYNAGFEVVGELSGTLGEGDSLVLFSDGVSQAGMGYGYDFGIGSSKVSAFINENPDIDVAKLPQRIAMMGISVSEGHCHDDTTVGVLHSKRALEVALLSGPPSKRTLDRTYVQDFIRNPGKKIVCGSTTAELVARELGAEISVLRLGESFGEPPEYYVEGIDIVSEGAVTLNQVLNILEEPTGNLSDGTVVERICLALKEADVVTFIEGNARNAAHEELLFRQIGMRVRKTAIRLLAERLKKNGKLVVVKNY